MSFRIINASCTYEKEPLKTAFDFKGSALTCLWQSVVKLETEENSAIGLGVQSVLWSDSALYSKKGEEEGNRLMFSLTCYAVELLKNMEIETPDEVISALIPELYTYAVKLTSSPSLRLTFVLNSLVPVDFALWQLWCKENGKSSFDDICTFDGVRQDKLLNIPLITYNTPLDSVKELAEGGASLLKIKIGSNPLGNDDKEAMLEWDKNRITDIHNTVSDTLTAHTESKHILYYLDANGRYDTKDRLLRLIDHADKCGFLDRIILLEEPFDEQNKLDVSDIPVCVAADESAHSVEDVEERISLGYKALALKPIAKTLSMTALMAKRAREHNMFCFCADLTVNPMMVSWNQCVASRLAPLSGMKIGVVESNGAQNYSNWDKLQRYHPLFGEAFTKCEKGIYILDNSFYTKSGGIFESSAHYKKLFEEERA